MILYSKYKYYISLILASDHILDTFNVFKPEIEVQEIKFDDLGADKTVKPFLNVLEEMDKALEKKSLSQVELLRKVYGEKLKNVNLADFQTEGQKVRTPIKGAI